MKLNHFSRIIFIPWIACALSSALSYGGDTPDASTVCQDLQELRTAITWKSRSKDYIKALNLIVRPGIYALPEAQDVSPADDRLMSRPSSSSAPAAYRNIIFSLGPTDSDLRNFESETVQTQLKILDAQIEVQKEKVSQLYQASLDLDYCEQLQLQLQFDPGVLQKLYQKRSVYRAGEQRDEEALLQKIVVRHLNKLHLDWEYRPSTDLAELHTLLKSPDVANVMIISHGESSGKLVDSMTNEYPTTFFGEISPSIQNIAFYSCYSDKVAGVYGLEAKLSSGMSEHKLRSIISTTSPKLTPEGELAPLAGAWKFLKKFDADAAYMLQQSMADHASQPESYPVRASAERCAVQIKGLDVKEGSLGVSLNRRFIGAVHSFMSFSGTATFDYPCSDLDRSENVLIVQGIGLLTPVKLLVPHFEVSLIEPSVRHSISEIHHYIAADGTYLSSKITIR